MNRRLKILVITTLILFGFNMTTQAGNINNLTVKDIELNDVKLADYKGKVLLIVNVASKCGYTRQYEGLQKVYEKRHKNAGTFISYNVSFKMFDKITLKGEDKSALFKILTDNQTTGTSPVKWNFEKFIVDKNGNVTERFRSSTEPESKELISAIERELKK